MSKAEIIDRLIKVAVAYLKIEGVKLMDAMSVSIRCEGSGVMVRVVVEFVKK